jgi:hypothetical protein
MGNFRKKMLLTFSVAMLGLAGGNEVVLCAAHAKTAVQSQVQAGCPKDGKIIEGKCFLRSKTKPLTGVVEDKKCPGRINRFINGECYSLKQVLEKQFN